MTTRTRSAALGLGLLWLGATCGVAQVASQDIRGADSREFYESVQSAAVVGSIEELRHLQTTADGRVEAAGAENAPTTHRFLYALAYVQWRISQLPDGPTGKKRKSLLKEAQAHLDRILEEDPDHAEAQALRGSVLGARITGGLSGMLLGPKSSSSMERALELAPDNARVALQHGISLFHMPKSFGGGAEPAEAELLRARELFEGRPAREEWPFWGRLDVLVWLGQTKARLGRLEEARDLYLEVLELEPEFTWVRDVLLVSLERSD